MIRLSAKVGGGRPARVKVFREDRLEEGAEDNLSATKMPFNSFVPYQGQAAVSTYAVWGSESHRTRTNLNV